MPCTEQVTDAAIQRINILSGTIRQPSPGPGSTSMPAAAAPGGPRDSPLPLMGGEDFEVERADCSNEDISEPLLSDSQYRCGRGPARGWRGWLGAWLGGWGAGWVGRFFRTASKGAAVGQCVGGGVGGCVGE